MPLLQPLLFCLFSAPYSHNFYYSFHYQATLPTAAYPKISSENKDGVTERETAYKDGSQHTGFNCFHPSLQVAQWEQQDSFIRTTFLVIRCLSLFDHSDTLQFKVTEIYDSRFFQTKHTHTHPRGKNPFFSSFQRHSCLLCEITFIDNTFHYNSHYEILSWLLRTSIISNSSFFAYSHYSLLFNTHIESP